MKTIVLITFMLVTVLVPTHSQVTLNAGDSYTNQFATLRLVGPGTQVAGAVLDLWVDRASLRPGDALLFEMFEDTPAGSPILSRTVTADSSSSAFQGFVANAWQDLQGSIRLTAVSGSVTVRFFTLQARVLQFPPLVVHSTTIVPNPPLRLSVTRVGPTELQISWPTNHTGYALESAPTLPALAWTTVTNSRVITSDHFYVKVHTGAAQEFFRLRKL